MDESIRVEWPTTAGTALEFETYADGRGWVVSLSRSGRLPEARAVTTMEMVQGTDDMYYLSYERIVHECDAEEREECECASRNGAWRIACEHDLMYVDFSLRAFMVPDDLSLVALFFMECRAELGPCDRHDPSRSGGNL